MAQMLARKHVLGLGTAAEDAWRTLGKAPFPVLLFVAEKDSACSSESLASMKVSIPIYFLKTQKTNKSHCCAHQPLLVPELLLTNTHCF